MFIIVLWSIGRIVSYVDDGGPPDGTQLSGGFYKFCRLIVMWHEQHDKYMLGVDNIYSNCHEFYAIVVQKVSSAYAREKIL